MSEIKAPLLFPALEQYVATCRSEFDWIPDARKRELMQLADYVRDTLRTSGESKLTFICTHNSRRSHYSQIWAKVAADVFGLPQVQTYSGGTEATAMNRRVIESLKRSGFRIDAIDNNGENPRYRLSYSDSAEPLVCWSKIYDELPNPTSDYCAIMTCSSADDACPIVSGCELRLPIRYEDPKVADDTPQESFVYDERSRQICREMQFAMSQVGTR